VSCAITCNYLTLLNCIYFLLPFSSCISHCPSHWTSLSESYAAQAKKAAHILHSHPGGRVGETLSQTKVSRIRGACGTRQRTQDDRCPGEDVVPKQTHQMEVSSTKSICNVTHIQSVDRYSIPKLHPLTQLHLKLPCLNYKIYKRLLLKK